MNKYSAIQCVAAPLGPFGRQDPQSRIRTLIGALTGISESLAGSHTLKVVLAPELFLTPDGEPLTESAYHPFLEEMVSEFKRSRFKDWLIVPGSICFQTAGVYFNVAHIFLGGTENATHVLKQTLDNQDGRSNSKNGVSQFPGHPLSAGGHPCKRVLDFFSETGLRVGLEIGIDHLDGLLWSVYSTLPESQLHLQLVPSSEPIITCSDGRILGNTAVLEPGGLLFGCCSQVPEGRLASDAWELFLYLGDGRFRLIHGSPFVSRHGRLIQFPPLPFPLSEEMAAAL